MHAAIGSWTVTLHVALRPSLCAVVVFFCVAETSDIKAYLTVNQLHMSCTDRQLRIG